MPRIDPGGSQALRAEDVLEVMADLEVRHGPPE